MKRNIIHKPAHVTESYLQELQTKVLFCFIFKGLLPRQNVIHAQNLLSVTSPKKKKTTIQLPAEGYSLVRVHAKLY